MLVIDLQYLPCIDYFIILLKHKRIYFDIYEYYEKQSYRNRCQILQANGIQSLSVPIKKKTPKQAFKTIEIDKSQKWQHQHWQSIQTAYGKAAFFEHYADYFKAIYEKKHTYLYELNLEILTLCLKILDCNLEFETSKKYVEKEKVGTIDWRSAIHPKKQSKLLGLSGSIVYEQVFGKNFVPNMSIIDMIFCEGTEAIRYLKKALENIKL